jgi:Co/Zn/Cd efflux system component
MDYLVADARNSCCLDEGCAAEPIVHRPVDDCCAGKSEEIAALGALADVRRVLIIVLIVNFAMFIAELGAGIVGRSTSLVADSVDMLGDALVYVLSLYALNRGLRWRAGAALAKAATIALFGIGVGVEVVLKLIRGVTPVAHTMVLFGSLALAANLLCLGLLYRYRNRDVNMSSTFECSRNDVIANVGVLLAASGVHLLRAGWPEILVGAIIAVLFLRSAIHVLREAWPQYRTG